MGLASRGARCSESRAPRRWTRLKRPQQARGGEAGRKGLVPPPSERRDSKIKCSCHRNINWEENLEMTLEQKTGALRRDEDSDENRTVKRKSLQRESHVGACLTLGGRSPRQPRGEYCRARDGKCWREDRVLLSLAEVTGSWRMGLRMDQQVSALAGKQEPAGCLLP